MRDSRRNVMRSVKINKTELLGVVRGNKTTHEIEFNEAVEDYKKAMLKVASDNLKLVKTGDLVQIAKTRAFPQKPASYADSYSRAIRMLELSVDDVIELEEDVFNQLVLDEWHWKHSFTVGNALYKSM